jgi:hypothetical protein
MRTTNPRYERGDLPGIGPQLGFAAAALAGLAAGSGLVVTISADLMMPVVATLLLAFAAGFATIAWRRRDENPARVTYADVAGALTLIGLCAAATIDPDQFARIVESDSTQP